MNIPLAGTTEQKINTIIRDEDVDTNKISDGYHTFGELYEHRIVLYIALCKSHSSSKAPIWRSRLHSDGTSMPGWFLLGIFKSASNQITYHLPDSYWEETKFAETLDQAPKFDGHTSSDVLDRIKMIL